MEVVSGYSVIVGAIGTAVVSDGMRSRFIDIAESILPAYKGLLSWGSGAGALLSARTGLPLNYLMDSVEGAPLPRVRHHG